MRLLSGMQSWQPDKRQHHKAISHDLCLVVPFAPEPASGDRPKSNSVDGLPGSDVINMASLSVAIFPGASVNLAASCQGSRSDRASVDRTVSGRPLLSSPTGANRKSSNSDESLDTDEGLVITTTRLLSSLFRTMKPVMQNDSTTVVSADPKYMLFGELRQDREIPKSLMWTAREPASPI